MSLKCIFLKGWIRGGISDPGIALNWEKSVKEANEQNCELVVFKIPKGKRLFESAATIGDIEKLIQDKYPNF